MKRGEALFLAAAVVLATALVSADHLLPRSAAAGRSSKVGSFLSAAAYCAAPGTRAAGEGAVALVGTTNPAKRVRAIRRSGSAGGKTSSPGGFNLGPQRFSSVTAGEVGAGEGVALVESFGARLPTDLLVTAPDSGVSAASCAAGPSARSFFPVASTARGRDTYLLLANPFEEEARVAVRVVTATDDDEPSLLQNLIVPGHSQSTLLLAEFFRETDWFGMQVNVERGRVVASKMIRFNGKDTNHGMALEQGAQEPSTTWLFGGGEVPASGEETFFVLNPTDREALIEVSFPTEAGAAAPTSVPKVAVSGGRLAMINVSATLPRGTRHGSGVTSTNGVPVVVERLIATPSGVSAAMGVARSRRGWSTVVSASSGGSEWIAIANFGAHPVVARMTIITDGPRVRPGELGSIRIEPGGRSTVDITPFLQGKIVSVLVQSRAGVFVVEHRLVSSEFKDFADTAADPLR